MATGLVRQWYRQWLDRRIPPARQVVLNQRRIFILPTGYGLFFILVAISLFVGGINYENNLILGLAFLMVSLFVIAILHTYRNLAGLGLAAGASESGFAGAEGALEVLLHAADRHAHRSLRLRWPGGRPADLSVELGQEQSLWLKLPLPRRGRVKPGRLRVETRYPLGLLRAWSLVDLAHECLAWPRPLPGGDCPSGGGSERQGQVRLSHGSDDFQGLRGYREGDSPRLIDWKAYARSGSLQTKYFADPAQGWLWLEWQRLPGQDAETRLSRLAWWVLEMERLNRLYGLRLPDAELVPGQGPEQRRRALDRLAGFGGD